MSIDAHLQGVDDTRRYAEALGRVAHAGDLLGLRGDLGAGKTAFVQGLAVGLGIPEEVRVTSPTFTLVNEYRGGRLDLIHADLYRIDELGELDHIGLYEACDSGAVVAIEWCDKFPVLPADHLAVELDVVSATERRLLAVSHGPVSAALLGRWQAALGGGSVR